jgi:hypothetical protein
MIAFISIPFPGLDWFSWCFVVLVVWFGLLGGFIPLFSPKIPKKISTIINTMTKQKKPFQCSLLKLSRKNPKG